MSSLKSNAPILGLLLCLIAAPASADGHFTMRMSNGYQVTSHCHHSAYGTFCDSQSSGNILGGSQAQSEPISSEQVPKDWAAKCHSCADLSEDAHR